MSDVFCISCGTKNQQIANYCFQCGTKLQKSEVPDPTPLPTNKKAVQKRSKARPHLLKSKSMNALVQLATVQHRDDFKNADSNTSGAFRATVISAVIQINQTLKPIDLPSVQRLFDDEKELNETTITDIDPVAFCARAKQYNITTSHAKRILNELQSIDKPETTGKESRPPRLLKAKSLSALQSPSLWEKEKWLRVYQDKDKLDGIMDLSRKATPPSLHTNSMNALQDREAASPALRQISTRKATPPALLQISKKLNQSDQLDKLRAGLLAAESMKALTDCTDDLERQLLMKGKLELCALVCDFNNTVDGRETNRIENKKDLLLEVLQCMSGNTWNNIELLQQCIETICRNLFRSLPSPEMIKTDVNDDEMDFREPSWDHLQLVYEITFHVVTNTHIDKNTMKKNLQGAFLENLIHLFSSADDREPQYVKIIVHAIYGRFMMLRKVIRKHLSDYCYQYVYLSTLRDVTSWQGLPEILEIFCSIFQGLNVPVKPDYHAMFRNVIVPLHKSFHLDEFHEQLLQCCTEFVTKDPYSAPIILGGILKFWPLQSPLKEQLFITEIVHILNVWVRHPYAKQSDPVVASITIAVLNKFVECTSSMHHQVAERSLMVWRDETVRICVDLHREKIWPKIYKALQYNKEKYWLSAIRNINRQIMSDFKRRDPEFWEKIEKQQQDGNNNKQTEEQNEEAPLPVPQQPG